MLSERPPHTCEDKRCLMLHSDTNAFLQKRALGYSPRGGTNEKVPPEAET